MTAVVSEKWMERFVIKSKVMCSDDSAPDVDPFGKVDGPADMVRLQGPCNRLRLRLLENSMITITITRFINVIDYDYDYIVK